MPDRTVKAKFLIDVAGAIANVNKLGATIKDSAKNAGKDFDSHKKNVDDFSTSIGAVGATAAIGVGLAIKKFADFDKQMSAVKAATHETAGNMDLLRQAAIDAGAETSFSATEAAEGIENLAKAGVSTKDILGGGLKGALDLAAAGQIGVADAAETAASAMTQFNLTGKDVPHIADLLAAGAGKAQGEVSDMAQALKQSGLVAAQFGVSIEETTGTLAAFASAGLIGSDAGTSFKTMLIALANPSKESSDLMKQLGINAYDASGAFIGIAPLAAQLQDRLKGLTEAQRNQALAQIFGTDAIRAANVLYTQGASGITDWTTKVNDAGFASETARIQMDNLSGDLETLGGSFETALIKSGSGANSVLRAIVQTATSAVNLFGNLPGPIQGTVTALAGIVAIGGTGAAALLKAVSAARSLQTAWLNLGRAGRTATLSAGAIGVALTIAAAVYGHFASESEKAKQRTDDLKSTLDEATGAITKNTRAFVSNQLATSGTAEKAKSLGLNLAEVTDAALGNETALKAVVAQLDAIAASNMDPDTGALGDQAKAARDVIGALTGMNGSLTEAQKQQKLAAEGAKQNTGATAEQATAAGKAATANQQQAQASKAAAEAAAQQDQATSALIQTLSRMPGLTLSLRDAQRGWFESLASANAALKENGKTLDITTPKGRANQTALDGMAKSANDVTEAMLRNGSSNKAVVATYDANRAGLVKTAQQFGLNKKQAEAYASSVLEIPTRTNTDVKANITDLQTKLATAKSQLKTVPANKRTELLAKIADLEAKIAAAKGQIASVPSSKTVTITTNLVTNRVEHITSDRRLPAPGRAYGGPVPGWSPNSRADNVHIRATAGEWVHQVAAVNYYGPGFMDDVNNMRYPKPNGYAGGGQVSAGWGSTGPIFMPPIVSPVTNVSVPIEIGGEVVRTVQLQISGSNAALKRNVYHKRGA